MTDFHEDLMHIADRLERYGEQALRPEVKEAIDSVYDAAETVGKAWSGSWLGYQARIYFKGLQTPPSGEHYNIEWGSPSELWLEHTDEVVTASLLELVGNPDFGPAKQLAEKASQDFDTYKSEILSILDITLSDQDDSFLVELRMQTNEVSLFTFADLVDAYRPKQAMSRDTAAAYQGFVTPPHLRTKFEMMILRVAPQRCYELGQWARKAGSHIERRKERLRTSERIGTNVFIGHGRSLLWRDLKDFISDRLHLPWDEFDRVPVAGVTNISRLSEMLDAAALALLVLTGEDEQNDGKVRARENVVHEAGLFQGRLGFTRAIILLEEGCEEFSNIQGLGQIRFPKGNIKAAFEEVRQVLEREEVISAEK